jgi:hypothetical protein
LAVAVLSRRSWSVPPISSNLAQEARSAGSIALLRLDRSFEPKDNLSVDRSMRLARRALQVRA